VNWVGGSLGPKTQGILDLADRDAMLAALAAVAVIPVELHAQMYVRLGGRSSERCSMTYFFGSAALFLCSISSTCGGSGNGLEAGT
jgi:hypothetical protein